MKIFLFILFISAHLLYGVEITGIKFEGNEEMANSVLYHFYPEINSIIKEMNIEDIHIKRGVNIRDIKVGIPNFTLDRVKFKFTESGINIKITDLKADLFARAYISNLIIPFTKHGTATINSFNLEVNLRVTSQKKDGKIYPYAEFNGAPKHSIDLDVHIGGFLLGLNSKLEKLGKNALINSINSFIQNKSENLLQKALEKIPVVIPIDESKGYYIDYSLVQPIQMKNGYLEVNSYAFFYNDKKEITKNRKKYALSLIPPLNKINNQYQLFISEYSINSFLFTYFSTDSLSLTVDSKIFTPILLGAILPEVYKQYGSDKAIAYFKTIKESVLELSESGITGRIFGQIIIKDKKTEEIIFQCNLELVTEVEIIVKENIVITGKINKLAIKKGEVSVNKCSSKILIEENINALTSFILPIANEVIEKGIKFELPVFFKNIKIEHKKQYLAISYMLKKEIYYDELQEVFTNVSKIVNSINSEKDQYKIDGYINTIADSLNIFIYKCFKNDKNLKSQLYLVTNQIRKYTDYMNDQNKLKDFLSQLKKVIMDINKYVEIEDLSLLYTRIENAILKNDTTSSRFGGRRTSNTTGTFGNSRTVGGSRTSSTNTRSDTSNSRGSGTLIDSRTRTSAVGTRSFSNPIVTLAQNIMFKLINKGSEFFIMSK